MRVEDAFGRAVRRLRDEAGLTQEALAHSAGVSMVYVSEIERGRRSPSVRIVVQLAQGLKISPARFFEVMGL